MLMYADRYIDAYVFEEGEQPDVDILTPGLVATSPLNEMVVFKKFRQRLTHTATWGFIRWYALLRKDRLANTILTESDFQLVGAYFLDANKKPKLHKLMEFCKNCPYYPQLLVGQCGDLSTVLLDNFGSTYNHKNRLACRVFLEFPNAWRTAFEEAEYRNKEVQSLLKQVEKLEDTSEKQNEFSTEAELEEVWK